MRTRIFVCLLLLALPVPGLQAQQVGGTISGRVTDQGGQPLSAVQVIVDGTSLSALTAADGRYTINGVPAGEVVVQATALGYETARQVVTVQSGQTAIGDLALAVSAIEIEQIVAVGYGTQRRETLTGSISDVAGDIVATSPAPNLSGSLAGRLPGLTVQQRSGEPGTENFDIVIRGLGTYGNNNPLIVVDGVERDNWQRLNPEDIETVTVLKDASAAIYGARAANGVILINTKRGAVGPAQFDVSFESAFASLTRRPDVLSSGDFAQFFNEARFYDAGRPANWTPTYTDEALTKFRNGSDPILYPDTDWPAESFKSHSLQRTVGIQATGGNEAVQYRLSFGYMDQGTDFKNNPNNYTRYNLRAVLDAQLTEDLRVGANLAGTINNRVDDGGDYFPVIISNPTLVSRYPNGLLAGGRFGQNPLLRDRFGRDETEDTPIYTTFTAAYDAPFLDGLNFDFSFNYDQRNTFRKDFNTPWTFHEYNTATGEYDVVQGEQSVISLRDTYSRSTTLLSNLRATYTNTFAQDHNVSLMVGGEQQKDRFWNASAYRRNFVSAAIPQIDVGSVAAEDQETSGGADEGAYNNLFGRVNYDFQSKYLVEFVFRYDGSPIFPEGKRYGFFPSVSLGWRLSEEPFFQERFPFVNDLKLRASRGKVGSDRVPEYQYLQAFQFQGNYVFGGVDAPGIQSSVLPNPNITWEESLKTDLGLEATLWDGGLGVDFTYWRESRTGILSAPQLAVSRVFGFPALPDLNIGETEANGYELVLSHSRALSEDFSYQISGNVAYAKSKIIYLDEVPPAEDYQKQEGNPVDANLYYVSDGIFNTQAELDGYPHRNNAQLGDIKIRDMNGDGEVNADDRVRWDQSETPDYILGLNAGFQYKALDLQLFFQGQAGAVIYEGTMEQAGHTDGRNTWPERYNDRWTVDNPDGTMPRAGSFTTQPGQSDFFLYDATFMRLKTLELGLSLPESMTARLPEIENARLYVSGFNVLTWAKEIKWMDPEMTGGVGYAPQRILNIGVDVSF
jgi:TonB-linked SusC/RagA family outer membrane protein